MFSYTYYKNYFESLEVYVWNKNLFLLSITKNSDKVCHLDFLNIRCCKIRDSNIVFFAEHWGDLFCYTIGFPSITCVSFYFFYEQDAEVLSVTDGPVEATKQSGEKIGLPTVPWIFLVLSYILNYTVKIVFL